METDDRLIKARGEYFQRQNDELRQHGNRHQRGLTEAEITSLCDAAQAAWDKASRSAREVIFTWRRKRYKSRLSSFYLRVEALDGSPVAERLRDL